jgi:hypothetical protein
MSLKRRCFLGRPLHSHIRGERPDRGYLRDVLTGFRPVEMESIARQNDYAPGRIYLEFIRVEPTPYADIENAGDNCVNSIFRMPVWHQFHTVRHLNSYRLGGVLRRLTDNDCQPDRGWERRKWLPVDVVRQYRPKTALANW